MQTVEIQLLRTVSVKYPSNYYGHRYCKDKYEAKEILKEYPANFLHILGRVSDGRYVLEIFGPHYTASWY